MSVTPLRKRLTGGLVVALAGAALTGCTRQSSPSVASTAASSGASAPQHRSASPASDPARVQPAGAADAPAQGTPVEAPPAQAAPADPSRASVAAPLREDEKATVSVEATLQNLEGGKARFDVKGRVGYLPNGAVLTISLRVRELFPVIEAAFFQVEVKDGNFEGFRAWEQGTLAPIGYQTVVTLSMQSQNPIVRKFLSKELGYVSETTATIGTDDDDIGAPDERSAFAIETLRQLSRFTAKITELQGQLAPKLETEAGDDWEAFAGSYNDALKATLDEIGAMKARYIIWYEGHRIAKLEQCLRVLSRAARNHGKGQDAKGDSTMVLNDLIQLKADIDARLPLTPGQAPPPSTEKTPEKR